MLHPRKQEPIEELLRKSLLGEELINTQFHLFSARSSPSRRVLKPRVLCANNALLAKSSKYFLDLCSSDINASDPLLVDLAGDHDIPGHARIDEYGYGSDSDLDDCNDPIPVSHSEGKKDQFSFKDNDELSDDGSESVSSDMFVMSPEQPKEEELFAANKDGGGSVASSETAVHNMAGNKKNQAAMRLRSLGSRHIFVKDTAFQTWYTLLNYLYTDQFNFLPLTSATPGGQPPKSLTEPVDEPRCSAKSMYRLASKVGLDNLREDAFSYIRSNLTEHNILRELSCSLVSTHPELLDMELDVLYSHISSSPVVAGFPDLARRIANKELPHGADIIIGLHTRVLRESRPLPWRPSRSVRFSVPPTSTTLEDSDRDAPEVEDEDADAPVPSDADSPPPPSFSFGVPQVPTILSPPPVELQMPTPALKHGPKGGKKGPSKQKVNPALRTSGDGQVPEEQPEGSGFRFRSVAEFKQKDVWGV